MKKLEFSKRIFVVSFTLVAVITVLSVFLMFRTGDLSPLSELIRVAYAVLGIATGFYYNKAKRENVIKLKKENKIEITQEDFRDESFTGI